MPILTIQHEDGRTFNVAEQAFKDLYEPFGFKPTAVIYGGEAHAYTDENVEAAKAYEKAGYAPNVTPLTLETASRQAAEAGMTERAAELAKQANTLRKAVKPEAATTNPPNTDLAAGPVAKENDPGRGLSADGEATDTTKAAAKASATADSEAKKA